MSEQTMEVDATLALCPECREPMALVNGMPRVAVTFWTKIDKPMVTPHALSCSLRGKALA